MGWRVSEVDELKAEIATLKAECRKYKLAGLGMAASIGEHVCVPDGFMVVPVTPTYAMCEAGASVVNGNAQSELSWISCIYSAMLAESQNQGVGE